MQEDINDTELEVEEEVLETTPEETPEETVETFSEDLDKAETEEEVMDLIKDLDASPKEEPTDEPEPELDTEPTEATDYLNLKDGDIELKLNFNSEKERKQLVRLAQQGLNYAGKTTELAKHRSFVQYAEENGITLEDIQRMASAKGGSKEALSNIAKTAEVDVFDLDNDMADDYKPEPVQIPQQADPRLDMTANEILSNDEYRESFQKWFPTMPQDIQNEVTSNPQVLMGVKEDLESGAFGPAMEQAYKYQRIEGMDFGSAYTRAKNELAVINTPEPTNPVSRGDRVRASGSRPTASAQSNRAGLAVGVISDLSDEEFLSEYRNIIADVQRGKNAG